MKIALAKVNQTAGKIKENTEKILSYVQKAEEAGCELIVFPLFAICGGPCGFLFENKDFIDENIEAAEFISKNSSINLICGEVFQKTDDNTAYIFADNDIELLKADIKNFSANKKLIVVISCLSYYERKIKEVKDFFTMQAVENNVNIAYLNMLGAQDGYIFDGLALYVNKKGKFKIFDQSFKENLIIFDTDGKDLEIGFNDRNEELYKVLVLGLKDYMNKNGFKKCALGISGGIDSALTAAIAVDAVGAENVLGVLMPSKYTSEQSGSSALKLCKNLNIKTKTVPIENIYNTFINELTPFFDGKEKDLTEENLQARIRGNILMSLSNKFGYLILCTGNKSEDAVGYSTLYGDTSGGYAPISDLYKKDVYTLAKYRNTISKVIPDFIIERPPTAELRENQKDSDSLPEYDILDDILEKILDKKMSYKEIIETGVKKEVLDKVWKLIKNSEYKRRQSPAGTKVSKSAFIKDIDLPITNGYLWNKTNH